MKTIITIALLLCMSNVAQAHHRHQRHYHHHQRVVTPAQPPSGWSWFAQTSGPAYDPAPVRPGAVRGRGGIVANPSGCPSRAFCGCGASIRVFGRSIRSLWVAANWYRFPRAAPGAGMVAVRRHHVFVLEQHLGNDTWLVYDANSGGHATRIHPRSIAGFTIVNPRAA